jgi:hypothetical protein
MQEEIDDEAAWKESFRPVWYEKYQGRLGSDLEKKLENEGYRNSYDQYFDITLVSSDGCEGDLNKISKIIREYRNQ